MVPAPPAADADADPAWLARLSSIVALSREGAVIGLDGAHRGCVGPLIERLLDDGAPVSVCFEAHELLDSPKGARVVLLHAARDAERLNRIRPVISERRLCVLVWLEPGDRRALSLRARDFLDWMQASVEIPDFPPRYATKILTDSLANGRSLSWEGGSLRLLTPAQIPRLSPSLDSARLLAAMRAGPVILRRPRADELPRLEALHRAAGQAHAIIWDEPEQVPADTRRVIAEALDWELASSWLAEAGVPHPRITAARLDLDPIRVAELSARAVWAPPIARVPPNLDARTVEPRDPSTSTSSPTSWWAALVRVFTPGEPAEPAHVVARPATWPGLAGLTERLQSSDEARGLHLVAGGKGSGVSTELRSLASSLRARHSVVYLDVEAHFERAIGHRAALASATTWELMFLIGLAVVRVGQDLDQVRWGHELHRLERSFEALSKLDVDALSLAAALAGVDPRGARRVPWPPVPMGVGRVEPRSTDSQDARSSRIMTQATLGVVEELATSTARAVTLILDGFTSTTTWRRLNAILRELDELSSRSSTPTNVVLAVPLEFEAAHVPHLRSHTRIDDAPVIDVLEPTELGPGIAWMRELIERRMASIGLPRPTIPSEVLDQLSWASGGRPGQCVRLVRGLAEAALHPSAGPVTQLTTELIARLRGELFTALWSPGREQLADLLKIPTQSPPFTSPVHELERRGLAHRYPTPEGGHRYLPHPVLIEALGSA